MREMETFDRSLSEILEWLQQLNVMVGQESQRQEDGPLTGEALFAAWYGARPCKAARRAFLEELPDAHVVALAVLMYLGRDDDRSVEELVRTIGDRQSAMLSLGKTPVVEYLEIGAAFLGTEVVDALPEEVAQLMRR